MNSEQQYIDLFNRSRETVFSPDAAVLNDCRMEAYEAFCKNGLPCRKTERFRYTDMQDLFSPDYGMNIRRFQVSSDPYDTFRCFVPHLRSSLYFVVNDVFFPPSGQNAATHKDVVVDSLRHIAQTNPGLIKKHYNRLAADKDGIVSLNTMFAQDGLFVYVPANVSVERPVQIVNMLHSGADLMANRRVLILMGENSSLNILFCDHADSDVEFLSTQVAEIFVGENASLDITCVEETHAKNRLVSETYIEQQAGSRICHNMITLHNGITRNQLDILFQGSGAECRCNGCAILDKRQHVDNNIFVDHASANCESHELYKYVLDDSSKGAFAGKALVRPGSQKTTASMTSQNLCATKKARVYTQPMLEIYADDVKSSHGAAV